MTAFSPEEFFTLETARSAFKPDRIEPYKKAWDEEGESVRLHQHLFFPEDLSPGETRPAIVFFFGGGWLGGTVEQFYPHCRYLANRGMIASAAEYRVKEVHGTPPEACVRDGISALTWLHAHAHQFGINTEQILAGGGSAGGHVAAATYFLDDIREPGEEGPYHPQALVLFNPVIDNSPEGYGNDRVPAPWESFSPLHCVKEHGIPTIQFLGDSDKLIPVSTGEAFRDRVAATGVASELHVYEDQPHGFFNWDSRPMFIATVTEMDRFLTELGMLQSLSTADLP